MTGNQNFAANLEYLLKEKGITQAQLAADLEIQPSVVNSWTQGTAPRAAMFLTVANYFDVLDLNALLNGTVEELKASMSPSHPARFGMVKD